MTLRLIELEFSLLDKLMYKYSDETINKFAHRAEINYTVNNLLNSINSINNDPHLIKFYYANLISMVILKRAINYPSTEGLREVSYWLLIKLHSKFPDTMERILETVPFIGYWGDLNNIYKIVYESNNAVWYPYKNRLLNKIVKIWCGNLRLEEDKLNNEECHKYFSKLCKWIPREKSAINKDTKIVNQILKVYYPKLYKKKRVEAFKKYRKLITTINKKINTTEIYMCDKKFSKIDYSQVPSKCLEKNILGWLDINKKGKRKNILLLDRNIARNNYIHFIKNKYLSCNYYENKYIDPQGTHVFDKLDSDAYKYFKEIVWWSDEIDYFTNTPNDIILD